MIFFFNFIVELRIYYCDVRKIRLIVSIFVDFRRRGERERGLDGVGVVFFCVVVL